MNRLFVVPLLMAAGLSQAVAAPTHPTHMQMDEVRALSRRISLTAGRVHREATPYARHGYPAELEALENIRLVSNYALHLAQELQQCIRPTGYFCEPSHSIHDLVQLNRAYNRAHDTFHNLYNYRGIAFEMAQLTSMMEELRTYYGISMRELAAELNRAARDVEDTVSREAFHGDRFSAWSHFFKRKAARDVRELLGAAAQLDRMVNGYLSDVNRLDDEVRLVMDAYRDASISVGAGDFSVMVSRPMEEVQGTLAAMRIATGLEAPEPLPVRRPPVVTPPAPRPPRGPVVVPPRGPHPRPRPRRP